MKRGRFKTMHALLALIPALVITACASIGRPQGGPKDNTPPEFVSSNPAVGALNFNKQRLELFFDENVQLEDPFNKVIVSPVQKNAPSVVANGRRVSVELKDTLLPNTTYTIDFADAIKDLNEGNILDGFATYFSTGDSIDSLRIAGMVLEARTLEPAQGMLVGVYSNISDTAIHTLPFERIARTNQYGQFVIYNLKPGDYRIYALNDLNRDYHWDRTEDIAFYDVTVSPYASPIEVTDTLRSHEGTDSLATRQGVAYFPNDVLLTWFNEGYKSQYLKDYSRPTRRNISIRMAAPADSLPGITVASGPQAGRNIDEWALLRSNATLDSLEYWITDPAVLDTDSLYLSVRYQRTDTANLISWRTDTLKFFFRDPKPQKKKKEEAEADTLPPKPVFINLKAETPASQEIYRPVVFSADQPIAGIDTAGVHLEIQQDTLWLPVAGWTLETDSANTLQRRKIHPQWVYGAKYRLTIDSAAISGVYHQHNNAFKHEFTLKTPEDYSNLILTITGQDSLPMVVELLDKSDKVLYTAAASGGEARLQYVAPGTYWARLYIDSNGNGKWDTGNLSESIQPEEVYYYPKKFNLRKNWDVSQTWNIYETPLDLQKPYDVKQNKPKLKKGEKAPTDQGDEDEEDNDVFGDYNSAYGNARRNNTGTRNGTTRGTNNGNRPMGGGFRTNNF